LLLESLIDFGCESDVVECNSIVVAQDAFVLACTPRVPALQNVVELIVLAELVEVFEILYLRGVIAEHFVEEEVTVLETSHVNGDECNARPEEAVIGE
jgi:hypothetical protein